jgi:hypothetical protein
MADYHPLIAHAVAALDRNTGPARGALYEHARDALVELLRGVTPALDESQITGERLSLEEAIRKVEGEAAREAKARSKTAVRISRVKAPSIPLREQPAPDSSNPDPLHELAKLIGGRPSRR